MRKSQEIQIGESSQPGSDVRIRPRIEEPQSGIYEIGLPGRDSGTEIRKRTALVHQRQSGAGEQQRFAIPETEHASREIGVLQDCIESVARIAVRIFLAR